MVNIAVCDDDSEFIRSFTMILSKKLGINEIENTITVYNSGDELINSSENHDVLFLDIDMPDTDGFEVATVLQERKANTILVFVTFHDELVFTSFRFQPFRFMRKSCIEAEIDDVLHDISIAYSERIMEKYLGFDTKNGTVSIELKEITYIEIFSHKIIVHILSGDTIECTGKLSDYEKKLINSGFIRIHKSFLVNVQYVHALERNQVIMSDSTKLPLSRYKVNEVRKVFFDYLGRL